MKRTLGKVATHIVGGVLGGLAGFYLPLFVVLLCERGHELERWLSRFDTTVGGDFLIFICVLGACVGACGGSWLLAAWTYPHRRNARPTEAEQPQDNVWPPPPWK